jgi:hypothetical protein
MNMGGMQMTGRRDVSAFAHRRSARHHTYLVSHGKLAGWVTYLCPRKRAGVPHRAEFAQPKAQQDALFHPGIDLPLTIDLFRGANLSLRELLAELQKSLACVRILFHFAQRGQAFNRSLQ